MPRAGVKGNRGGRKGRSGRKSKAEEMGLQALLDECFTLEARRKLFKSLAEEATRSPQLNMEAAKLLLAYTFGRPLERKEVSSPGGESLLQPIADAIEKVYGQS